MYVICHISFALCVYELTFLLGGGEDGGETASKPVTTVQNCVPTFVNVKLLNVFNKTSGHFPATFVAAKSKNL